VGQGSVRGTHTAPRAWVTVATTAVAMTACATSDTAPASCPTRPRRRELSPPSSKGSSRPGERSKSSDRPADLRVGRSRPRHGPPWNPDEDSGPCSESTRVYDFLRQPLPGHVTLP
jgi:hypothetical protein